MKMGIEQTNTKQPTLKKQSSKRLTFTGFFIVILILISSFANGASSQHIIINNPVCAETTAEFSPSLEWSNLFPVSTLDHESSFYPDMAIDSIGNIHVVWEDESNGFGDIFYRILFVENSSWSAISLLSNPNSKYSARYPKIFIDTQDMVHFVWEESFLNVSLMYRTYDGVTFSQTISVAENGSYNDHYLAVNNQGDVFLSWEQNDDIYPQFNIHARIYSSIQQMWLPTRQITNTSYYSSATDVAADRNNVFHLVWGESSAVLGCSEIHYTTFQGEEFIQGNVSVISPIDGTLSTYPKIAIDRTDQIHLIWDDLFESNIYYRYFGSDNWSEVKLISGQGVSSDPAIYADAFNNIHIIWDENRSIYYKQKSSTSQWSHTIKTSVEELHAKKLSVIVDSLRGIIYIAMMEYFQENTWETYLITGYIMTKDNLKYLLILLGILPIILFASIIYFSKKKKQKQE